MAENPNSVFLKKEPQKYTEPRPQGYKVPAKIQGRKIKQMEEEGNILLIVSAWDGGDTASTISGGGRIVVKVRRAKGRCASDLQQSGVFLVSPRRKVNSRDREKEE